MVEYLLEFIERAHLDLNLQLEALLLEILVATVDGIGDAAGEVDMVVLEQDHVEESDAVVTATADLHGLLLEHTHAWGGLAGIEHTGAGALEALHVSVSHGGDAAHTLHDIEHEALCLQQGAHASADNHGDIALLHAAAVAHQHFHLHLRVETAEHLLGHFHASQDAILLDEQMATAHGILWDAAERGMVAVADILGKRQVNQSVDKFFYT